MDIAAARKIIEFNVGKYDDFLNNAKKGFDYYLNKDDINITGAAAIDEVNTFFKTKGVNPLRSADNRISINLHKIAVDQKIGYMFSNPPQFDLTQDNTDDKLLQKVKDTVSGDWSKVVKQVGIDASNTGRAWIHYWYEDNTKPFEYWFINPMEVIPVYDNRTAKKKLRYLIRYYQFYDEQGNCKMRYELWDDNEVAYYERYDLPEAEIQLEVFPAGLSNPMPHSYGSIPFIEFQNNAKSTSDLNMYKRIIDSMDKLISGFANDIDDIQEIIWLVKNYRGEDSSSDYDIDGNEITKEFDLLQQLKTKKWAGVSTDGDLKPIQGEIPYEARSAFYEILDKRFWVAAMAVNPTPDTAGNQSGVYIDHLYGLMEQKAGLMETEFRIAINMFLKAVLHYLKADETMQFDQTWKRTKPQNNTEISAIIAQTPSTVMSDETKTKMHPLITNWKAERDQIDKETKERIENYVDQLNKAGKINPSNNQIQPQVKVNPMDKNMQQQQTKQQMNQPQGGGN